MESFRRLWEQEVAEAEEQLTVETINVATGLLLPVWNKLPEDDVRVWRIDAGEGHSILGRIIRPAGIEKLEREFGLKSRRSLSPAEMIEGARAGGDGVSLPGWGEARLILVFVNGSRRLEIRNYRADDRDQIKAAGAFSEVIAYRTRLFLPTHKARDIVEALVAMRA